MKINNKGCKFKNGGRNGVDTRVHGCALAKVLNKAYARYLKDEELEDGEESELISAGEVNDVEYSFDFFSFLIGDKLYDDFSKVIFDCENIDFTGEEFDETDFCGYHLLDNGFEFVGFCAGGDWEAPLYGIIYHDGKKLRGYIPEWGNTFNRDTRTAFGSESESKNERAAEEYSDGSESIGIYLKKYGYIAKDKDWDADPEYLDPDVDVMIKDITERVVLK